MEMDDSVFLVLDFSSVCRLCLSSRGHLLSDIFHSDEGMDESPTLSLHEQITLITGIKISTDDNLPQQICYKCRHLVELCTELRDSAERSYGLLCEAANDMAITVDKNKRQDYPVSPQAVDTNLITDLSVDSIIQDDVTFVPTDSTILVCVKEESAVEQKQPVMDLKSEMQPNKSDNILENPDDTAKRKGVRTKRSSSTCFKRKKHVCELCLTNFPSRDELHEHVRTHYARSSLSPYIDASRPLNCEHCHIKVKNKRRLVDHHMRHLNLNPFVCKHPGCNFIGKSKDAYRHHGYTHAPPALVCETCGAAFRRAFELKQHRIRHTDLELSFSCEKCGVTCSNRITYAAHLLLHTTEKKYKCPRLGCPKAFHQRLDLEAHRRSHDNERLHACHLCVATYITKSQLNRHIRQHSTRRVNKCDKCCATFDNYAAFCNHRLGVHGAWQPYKCAGCNQGYQSSSRLEKHAARCRIALHLKSLESAGHAPSPGHPTLKQQGDQGLMGDEESMDTLDSLLLHNLKGEGDERNKTQANDSSALEAEGLLYIEADEPLDIPNYT